MTSIQGQLLKLYMRFERFRQPMVEDFDLAKERAEQNRIAGMFKALANFQCEPVNADGVVSEWITPAKVSGNRTILYFHGGYYLLGSINSHRNLAGNIATNAQARTLIIEYRLAPENPFPAGLEDAITAYRWLLMQGIKPGEIYLAGDSAGGGIVLAALLAMRERNIPLPAAGICISPATDLTMSSESWRTKLNKEFVVSHYIAAKLPSLYLGNIDRRNPLASPLFADLRGLPPLLIQVGSDETLLCDSTSLAERAREAGVEVRLEVWPGMFHVWHYTASMLPEGRQAIEKIAEFIQAVEARKKS